MKSHSDIADFRARKRSGHTFAFPTPKERPSWMEPAEDSGLLRMLAVGAIIAIFVVMVLGFWARVASDIHNDQWTRNTINECRASGRYAHVDRDAAQKVLDVRCDAFEEAK
jgi:hypothetical protein